jgi:hypothetical protein
VVVVVEHHMVEQLQPVDRVVVEQVGLIMQEQVVQPIRETTVVTDRTVGQVPLLEEEVLGQQEMMVPLLMLVMAVLDYQLF